jgi:hypothetical protein
MAAIGGHHRAIRGRTDDWLTPPEIVEALGPFDLDPCCPMRMPWQTAGIMLHQGIDDGLSGDWFGRVWLNPPYGPEVGRWVKKLAKHGNGIALVFARTDTSWFFRSIWHQASAVLFVQGRLTFHHESGRRSRSGHNSGAPSVLVAYGAECADRLRCCTEASWFGNKRAVNALANGRFIDLQESR